ncbi:MAG TPA: HAMP domain-containing sensor histidine kinase [Verrucomicrobiae bacterium]
MILLPVVVLSVICLFSLRQDKSIAEQDAKNLGGAVAAQIADIIGREAAHQLTNYFVAAESQGSPFWGPRDLTNLERETRLFEIQHPSGNIDAPQVVKNTKEFWHAAEKWQKSHSAIDLSTVPAVSLVLANSGRAARSRLLSADSDVYSPSPPDWVLDLTAEQILIWNEERRAEASGDAEAARSDIEKLLATNPSEGARADAGFHLLLLKTRNMAASEAEKALMDFRSPELTDAGLPIDQLAWYRALRLLPDHGGVPENLFTHIGLAMEACPSILCEPLVEETIRAAGSRPEDSERAAELKWSWRSNKKARDILKRFTDQHPGTTWSNGFVWAEAPSGNFLISLHKTGADAATGQGLGFYEISIFPETVVGDALQHALQPVKEVLPRYAAAEVELAARKFRLAGENSFPTSNTNALPVLGESIGEVAMPPQSFFAQPIDVRVLLADPDSLFAHQRQRTMAFAAVILTSTLAALTGLFAARRAFRRQLQLAEMKSNFVSSVSHELRAPIASVRLMAENLESGKIPETPRQKEYFRFITQECRRLSSLIENVLDFSRIEQGRKQYEFEPSDALAVVKTTMRLMEPRAFEREVGLELIRIPPDETGQIELKMDGQAIQQALVNLIDNAIKHSPKRESVTVTIETSGGGLSSLSSMQMEERVRERRRLTPAAPNDTNGENTEPPLPQPSPPQVCGEEGAGLSKPDQHCVLQLSVADHGPGIPVSEREKIFERFYRLGSELRRETEGIGIGLSIVKHIVKAHGGRIIVESELGKGSKFTIELPMRRENE